VLVNMNWSFFIEISSWFILGVFVGLIIYIFICIPLYEGLKVVRG